jgi:hypothetical protein
VTTLSLGAGLDPSDISNAPFLWHKGEDFMKGSTAIPLMYRMATVADVKPKNGKKMSRYLWKMPVKQVSIVLTHLLILAHILSRNCFQAWHALLPGSLSSRCAGMHGYHEHKS